MRRERGGIVEDTGYTTENVSGVDAEADEARASAHVEAISGQISPEPVPLARTRVYRELNLRNSALADSISACAAHVFEELGPGFPPTICEEALAIELAKTGIEFKKGHAVPVCFQGRKLGEHRFNFVIEDRIAVKLMNVENDEDMETLHFRSYLKACALETGLLLDFRAGTFSVKRVGNEVGPAMADRLPNAGSATSNERHFQPSMTPAVASYNPLSSSALTEMSSPGQPQDFEGRSRARWWMWGGIIVAVLSIVIAYITAVMLPARRLQTARDDIGNRFVQCGYLDSESSRRLVATLVTSSDTSQPEEIAKATKLLCDAISNSDLGTLQSETATAAMRVLEGRDGRSLPRELVPLRDIVREVRVLSDFGKLFGDSQDPKELEKRLARWQERIFQLRRSTFLNVQFFRAEYLVSLLSTNAESEFKKRTALTQPKE